MCHGSAIALIAVHALCHLAHRGTGVIIMAEESAEQQTVEAGTGSVRIPPYISFQTFLTFMKDLKTNGLPPQIDKSVMSKLAGGMQGQLKMGLRSLGLIDGDKPTDRFAALVDALDTPQFEPMLLQLLKDTYPYVFALDLMTATPTMFAEAFKVTGAKEDVSRKCRTFFLHAAKRAGVPLGNRILTGSVPRSPSNGPRRKKATKPKEPDGQAQNQDTADNTVKTGGSGLMEKLLEKFPPFDPKWPDDIKAKWFAGFEQFMQGATK
jgi:hypothetical protein